jgi:hypothetical protein
VSELPKEPQSSPPLLNSLDSDCFTAFESKRSSSVRQGRLSRIHLRTVCPHKPELFMTRNEGQRVPLILPLLHLRPVPRCHPVSRCFRREEDRGKRKLLPRCRTLHCRVGDIPRHEPIGIGHRHRRSLRSQASHATSVVGVLEAVRAKGRYTDGTTWKVLRPEGRSHQTQNKKLQELHSLSLLRTVQPGRSTHQD